MDGGFLPAHGGDEMCQSLCFQCFSPLMFVPGANGEAFFFFFCSNKSHHLLITSDAVQLWQCDCYRYCAFYQ